MPQVSLGEIARRDIGEDQPVRRGPGLICRARSSARGEAHGSGCRPVLWVAAGVASLIPGVITGSFDAHWRIGVIGQVRKRLSHSRCASSEVAVEMVGTLLLPLRFLHAVRSSRCLVRQVSPSVVAIASMEIRRPRGRATLAGADRAGGGSGM